MDVTALNRVKVFDEAVDVPRLFSLAKLFRKGAPFRVEYHGVHHVLATGGNNEISALHDHRVVRVSQCKLCGQFSGPTPSLFGKWDKHTGYHYLFDSRGRSASILDRNFGISKLQFSLKNIADLNREPGSLSVSKGIGASFRCKSSGLLMGQAILHGLSSLGSFLRLPPNERGSDESGNDKKPGVECEPSLYSDILCGLLFVVLLIWGGGIIVDRNRYARLGWVVVVIGFAGLFCTFSDAGLGSPFAFWRFRWLLGNDDYCKHQPFHDRKIVPRKYLTSNSYWGTVIDMANVLNKDKQIAVIGALAEGSSIRSIERLTGVHRDTIMRLGVRVGKGCAMLMDSKMQDLDCNYLQFDELWGFIGKKERHVSVDDNPELGDVWTFCAIDSETKLVPSFKCGKRTHATTTEFVQDVASRMRHRVQVSSDAMHLYVEAMELAFGADVDYGQCVKVYVHDSAHHPERQYSAPHFASAMRRPITGSPEMELVSTSHVERLNATTRLHMRRLTRLTLAFSKKLENFEAAVGLHFAYYNFVKRHNTLRCTPAMAAGVERDFWSVGDLVEATA
jgi:IS1 family transposase